QRPRRPCPPSASCLRRAWPGRRPVQPSSPAESPPPFSLQQISVPLSEPSRLPLLVAGSTSLYPAWPENGRAVGPTRLRRRDEPFTKPPPCRRSNHEPVIVWGWKRSCAQRWVRTFAVCERANAIHSTCHDRWGHP